MSENRLTVTIVSDLHCHPSNSEFDDTYLKSDLLRSPSLDHPVESLLELIKKENLTTDLTLCPGDLTNKSNKQGFISGWEFILEIHRGLNGKELIATLGNHDLDSFGKNSEYSYEIAKGIKKGFPYQDSNDCDRFWSKGCDFIEKENYRVLVINSSHFHYDKSSASSGKISDDALEFIQKYLNGNKDNKLFITLAHHHPIDHSRLKLGEEDKIVNSHNLLEILGKARVDLFIHGHKHDPLLRYHNCLETNYQIPILSSGSFSSTSNISFSGQRNTFHKIDLVKEGGNFAKGRIKTWSFMPKSGWKIRHDEEGFHSYTGFGFIGDISLLAKEIIDYVGDKVLVKWLEIEDNSPDVKYLIPTQAFELTQILEENNLIFGGGELSQVPKYIGNTKNLQ